MKNNGVENINPKNILLLLKYPKTLNACIFLNISIINILISKFLKNEFFFIILFYE